MENIFGARELYEVGLVDNPGTSFSLKKSFSLLQALCEEHDIQLSEDSLDENGYIEVNMDKHTAELLRGQEFVLPLVGIPGYETKHVFKSKNVQTPHQDDTEISVGLTL